MHVSSVANVTPIYLFESSWGYVICLKLNFKKAFKVFKKLNFSIEMIKRYEKKFPGIFVRILLKDYKQQSNLNVTTITIG